MGDEKVLIISTDAWNTLSVEEVLALPVEAIEARTPTWSGYDHLIELDGVLHVIRAALIRRVSRAQMRQPVRRIRVPNPIMRNVDETLRRSLADAGAYEVTSLDLLKAQLAGQSPTMLPGAIRWVDFEIESHNDSPGLVLSGPALHEDFEQQIFIVCRMSSKAVVPGHRWDYGLENEYVDIAPPGRPVQKCRKVVCSDIRTISHRLIRPGTLRPCAVTPSEYAGALERVHDMLGI